MTTRSHTEMHRDHVAWRSENNLWREELAIWQHEINEAIRELPRFEGVLRAHGERLQTHAAAIRLYEQSGSTHEHMLAEYERGESPPELVEQAQAHMRETEQHRAQQVAHEEIKRQQHVLITKWKLLCGALVATTKPGPSIVSR